MEKYSIACELSLSAIENSRMQHASKSGEKITESFLLPYGHGGALQCQRRIWPAHDTPVASDKSRSSWGRPATPRVRESSDIPQTLKNAHTMLLVSSNICFHGFVFRVLQKCGEGVDRHVLA